eukprot:scaffold31358_cov36-Phaeocystis_antarctica.AAC.3
MHCMPTAYTHRPAYTLHAHCVYTADTPQRHRIYTAYTLEARERLAALEASLVTSSAAADAADGAAAGAARRVAALEAERPGEMSFNDSVSS